MAAVAVTSLRPFRVDTADSPTDRLSVLFLNANRSTGTIYYGSSSSVSASSNDGSLTPGQSVTLDRAAKWFIAATDANGAPASGQVAVSTPDPFETAFPNSTNRNTLVRVGGDEVEVSTDHGSTWRSPGGPIFNVKNPAFAGGAKGDGSTDDTAAIQAAFTACGTAGGGTVYLPGGFTYKMNSSVTIASSNIRVEMAGATINFSGAGATSSAFTASGTDGTAKNLTANASAGNTSLTVAAGDEAAFTAGDYVRVRSTRKYDPGYTDTEDGEIGIVLSTASGTINLRSPLTGANYNTANSATVTKVTMLSNIEFVGGKIIGLPGSTHKAIKFTSVVKARVTDTEIQDCPDTGIWFIAVQDGRIDRVHVRFSNDASSGYGVNVSGPSQDCYIDRCYFRGCRHSTSVTGGAYGGIPRRIFFNGCHGIDTTSGGDCYDIHAPAEDIHFRNCHSFDSGNCGFQVEAAKVSIENCVVVRSANTGILCGNSTAAATELNIVGNIVSTTSGTAMGIRVQNSSLAGAGSTTNVVNIVGNTVSNAGGRAIYVVTTDTWRYNNVVISGNNVRSPGDATNAIQLQKADYCAVADNVITNATNTTSCIRIADVTYSTIAGNSTHNASISTGRSISVTTSADLEITGNVGSNGSSGIVFDSSTINCVVSSNNMRNCSTPYSLSTGGGHVVLRNLPGVVPATASATTTTLPKHSDVHSITGTTTITSVTADTAGRMVTLIFAGILTFTDGSNLKLNGNFVTSADDSITLVSDGSNWIEIARSVN